MKNIAKILNQITRNHTPLKALTKNEDQEIEIKLSEPYATLGLNFSDWDEILSVLKFALYDDDLTKTGKINDLFVTTIMPRYYNTVKRLEDVGNLPPIILSILTQQMVTFQTAAFKPEYLTAITTRDYLLQMSNLPEYTPQNVSSISNYIFRHGLSNSSNHALNGLNLIYWDNDFTTKKVPQEIFGLRHVWDHYDYPHIHITNSFEHHRILAINAVRRTWISTLMVASGTKDANFRINYGFMCTDTMPSYSKQQYEQLAILNHGTIIEPPYDQQRIWNMTEHDIENVIISSLKCIRYKPTLHTVYMTTLQLKQERLLGNNPISERYTIVLQQTFPDKLSLYSEYLGTKLPSGDIFNVQDFVNNTEVLSIQGKPDYQLHAPQTDHTLSHVANMFPYLKVVEPSEYTNYLNYLRNAASRQYLTNNIVRRVAPDGISLVTETLSERIIAGVSLNKDIKGINLAVVDSYPSAILELTDKIYINDYDISINILTEMNDFRTTINTNYSSLNVVVINPEVMPSTLRDICHTSNLAFEVYSTNSTIGMQLESFFSFGVLSANIIFAAISESNYLQDKNSYELFLASITSGTYYSIEFLDFSSEILLPILNSLLENLKIAQQRAAPRIMFAPPIISTMRVGIRIIFSLVEIPSIITEYGLITSSMIKPYCREISPSTMIIDPIKSLTYNSLSIPRIVPRMGTNIAITCNNQSYNTALGYMSTLCRYTTSKSFSNHHTYYEITGSVDQSRITCLDRIQAFKINNEVKPHQISPRDMSPLTTLTSRLTFNELVTQTDRLLLYISRRDQKILRNNLSDYGSSSFLNICLTDSHYTMYDIDNIQSDLVPGTTLIRNHLPWDVPLPYIEGDDVLIYNSLFMNPSALEPDLSVPIIKMLQPIRQAKHIYFNLPYMNDILYNILSGLGIATKILERKFIKLGKFAPIPCLNDLELTQVLAIFPQPMYIIKQRIPSLLDYYNTSRMLQRDTNSQTYYNALIIHQCLPFFDISS